MLVLLPLALALFVLLLINGIFWWVNSRQKPTEGLVSFKDPTRLSRMTRIWIAAFIVAQLMLLACFGLELQRVLAGLPPLDILTEVAGLVALLMLVTMAGTVFLSLKWIYRSNLNAHALGAERMEFSPVTSVWWYFVPVANLWYPLKIMREIWLASHDSRYWERMDPPVVLTLAWGGLIAAEAMQRFVGVIYAGQELPLKIANVVYFSVNIAAWCVMFFVVANICRAQMVEYRQQTAAG